MKPNVLKWSRVVAFVVLSNYLVSSMYAQDSIGPAVSARGSYLFGDWGGERTKLENAGVVFNLIYVDDVLTDMRGDVPNWSRVRGTLDIDFGKAELARGLKFHIAAMWQAGGVLGNYIGTIANPSSNASFDLTRLDSWWFEQSLAHDKVFLRAGQFAGLDSYGVQQYGETYIIEPLGYALGNLVTADYEPFAPAGTPAVEIRYLPSRHFYVKSAIFSGNRNQLRDDPSGAHFKIKDSPVIASEAGFLVDPTPSLTRKTYPGSYEFGATVNPGSFSNIVTGQVGRTNYLVYFMANQRIYRIQAGNGRGLDLNFAFDWTPDDVTKNFSQVTGGVRYHGIIPRRQSDTLSTGVVYSRISGVLNQSLTQAGRIPISAEKALEFSYSLRVKPWLTIQPVFQYYFDMGGNPSSHNHTIAGFRTTFVI
jgi:carbohydrate-selective porin OprB